MSEKRNGEQAPDASRDAEKSSGAQDGEDGGGPSAPVRLLVGVGASAGGLEAFNTLLDNLDEDEDEDERLTLFIVQHQSRDSDRDILSSLMERHTRRETLVAEDGMKVKPGAVHVAPPGMHMEVSGGRVRLTARQNGRGMPIDIMLRSLAREAGPRSVAVVLSGSDRDGTLGARAIMEQGGLVVAQDPDTTQFGFMPRSLIEQELADLVLAPSAMGAHIRIFADEVAPEGGKDEEGGHLPATLRSKLLCVLKNRTGHDFALYKESTVNRRIRRRMTVHQIERLPDYVKFIRSDAHEARSLFKDLLIGVTNFFRDPEAFDALADALAQGPLAEQTNRSLRAWVPGCSTGEEAYSLAMVLREAMELSGVERNVEIFATDLDEGAIQWARTGRYPQNIRADVSDERLQRFFFSEDSDYRIRPSVREMVVFAVQNLVQDPPFSNLDLVLCRNLLMYLKPEAQKRALSHFRYGLNPGGLLMLGTSEGVTVLPEPFAELSKKWRIFRLRPNANRRPLPGDIQAARVPTAQRFRFNKRPFEAGQEMSTVQRVAQQHILRSCCPATVMVSRNGDILYTHGRTGKYLEPNQGPPQANILDMAREGLRFDLTTGLTSAAENNEVEVHRRARVRTNDHEEYVDLIMRPVRDANLGGICLLVSFVPVEADEDRPDEEESDLDQSARGRIQELETDLRQIRENMQSVIEQYEAANEELKSANEELESTNEELKSTNEELETAKEELQSINEEQATLNSELQSKNDELANLGDDLNNLLSSTRIATLFLDQELRIRRFTPSMRPLMSLRDVDRGRPVNDLALRLDYPELGSDAAAVLNDLNTLNRDVQGPGGSWHHVRLMPYRTLENVIDGVVVTFHDITGLKTQEQEALHAQALAEAVLDAVRAPMIVLGGDQVVDSANTAFYRAFRTEPVETVGRPLFELGDGQWDVPELRRLLEEIVLQQTEVRDYPVEHDFPGLGPRRVLVDARLVPGQRENDRILVVFNKIQETKGQ